MLLAGLLGGCSPIKYQDRTVRGKVFPIPQSGDTPMMDLLAINWDSSENPDSFYITYLIPQGEDYDVLWEHELEQFDSWHDVHTAFDEGTVYYAAEASLLALNRNDGSISWKAPLSDLIWSGCPNCIQRVGDRIIVLTVDYVLQAIDVRDGKPSWSVRLNDSSIAYDGFLVIDEEIVLQDYLGPDLYDSALYIYSSTSGTVLRQVVPTCPTEAYPHWYDDNLFFAYDSSRGVQALFLYQCWSDPYMQSWDLSTGELNWQESVPAEMVSSPRASLLEQDTLYLKTSEGVFAVSLTSRRAELLVEGIDPDYDWVPLAEQEGVLLGWAERTRGSPRHELWGVDPTRGILWRHEMQADTLAGVDSGSADWAYWISSQGMILLHLREDPDEVVVETLDLRTGQVGESTALKLDYAYLDDIAWSRQQAFLTISGQVYAVDLQEAAISPVWP
jgi:outer membrane protein assembly factor BamB